MDGKRLRGTENYVYTIDDLLGKGATCEVYKGIHKVTGEVHALKIFENRLRAIAQREIDALGKLEHENIVAFMGQEIDRDTGRVVAVMEYCEKSLYMSLNEPENRFGLLEDEFFRFFQHTVAGMKHLREHGFLHRDIKPGNILIVQDQDGSNIYKLSDFGTAKPVLETEAFQSLVGTEEYLHPNIFKAAFIDQGMSREFDAAADLWSLGATLYHAATGKVPFQPYQGRNNRALMFRMIAQKEFGVIAGEQRTQGGEIVWSKDLPTTCRLSRWLKDALTEILRHLLEGSPDKAMTFETFFQAAEDLVSRHIVYVFSTTSAKHFRLYLRQDSVYSDVQQEIYAETNIPPRDQLIHYEECVLRDLISEKDQMIMYPRMSRSTPLVMIRSTDVGQCTMPEEKYFWYNQDLAVCAPVFSDPAYKNLTEDYHVAKSVCDSIALVQTCIEEGCITQELFEKTIHRTERWKELLVNRLKMEVELYRDRIKDLRHIHKAIMESGALQCCVPTSENISIEDVKARINNCIKLFERVQSVETDSGISLYRLGCVDGNKCQRKIERLLQRAKEKMGAMEGRRRYSKTVQGNLPYHAEQLHKFDKKQLTEIYNTSIELWKKHCQPKLGEVHNHFLNWHSSFAALQRQIEALQKEIRATKSAIKRYMRSFKVSSEPSSLVSVSSVTSLDLPPVAETEAKRRYLATSILSQLDVIKTSQAEMKRMVSENEEQIKSLEVMSLDDLTSYPTMTSSESEKSHET